MGVYISQKQMFFSPAKLDCSFGVLRSTAPMDIQTISLLAMSIPISSGCEVVRSVSYFYELHKCCFQIQLLQNILHESEQRDSSWSRLKQHVCFLLPFISKLIHAESEYNCSL